MDFIDNVVSKMDAFNGENVHINTVQLGETQGIDFVGLKDNRPYLFNVFWSDSEDVKALRKLMDYFDRVVITNGTATSVKFANDFVEKIKGV